jgi:hypothetical protein
VSERTALALCGHPAWLNGFFEWKTLKGAKAKQTYAIAMKGDNPFYLRN